MSNINQIYRLGVKSDGDGMWGAVLGGLLGGVFGSFQHGPRGSLDLVAVTIPIGILIGAALLNGDGITDRNYRMQYQSDRNILRQFARYPENEPPELRAIK